jgi:hypothetical protein
MVITEQRKVDLYLRKIAGLGLGMLIIRKLSFMLLVYITDQSGPEIVAVSTIFNYIGDMRTRNRAAVEYSFEETIVISLCEWRRPPLKSCFNPRW